MITLHDYSRSTIQVLVPCDCPQLVVSDAQVALGRGDIGAIQFLNDRLKRYTVPASLIAAGLPQHTGSVVAG